MDFLFSAVLLLVLFNANKSEEWDNETIYAKAGSNISLTWILPDTRTNISFSIGRPFEKRIATRLADQDCEVWDNSSMLCIVNSTDDRLIVVLHIFNVATRQSGKYILWKKTQLLDQPSYTYKHLVVIGKPNIMEVQKPILGLPFKMTCNTANEQKYYLYRWIINDVERTTGHNVNSHIISNLSINDKSSNVTCQVCLNETERNLTCTSCENYICSMDSDPYTIQVLYGPDNISLSRNERYFKLKNQEHFAIDCFATCYPNCTFWWKGRDTIQSQKLNMIFEPKLAGQYSCHVTNEQTNITVISDPITLHLAEEDKQLEDDTKGVPLSLGLAGVPVLLVVIGLLLVRQWRKIPSNKIDSVELSLVRVQQTETDISHIELERHIRHLHIPSNKRRESKRIMRLECPNKSPEDNVRPNLLEDHYNTIDDETHALSDYDLEMDVVIHKQTSHEIRRNNEHIHYDYAYSRGICPMEAALTHVADDTLLTARSNSARPVGIFQVEGNEVPDTDHVYITVLDDSSPSVELSQVEKLT